MLPTVCGEVSLSAPEASSSCSCKISPPAVVVPAIAESGHKTAVLLNPAPLVPWELGKRGSVREKESTASIPPGEAAISSSTFLRCTGCTSSPLIECNSMYSSSKTDLHFHPSLANSIAFRAALLYSSSAVDQSRSFARCPYSARDGMATTVTSEFRETRRWYRSRRGRRERSSHLTRRRLSAPEERDEDSDGAEERDSWLAKEERFRITPDNNYFSYVMCKNMLIRSAGKNER